MWGKMRIADLPYRDVADASCFVTRTATAAGGTFTFHNGMPNPE